MKSVWNTSVKRPKFKSIDGDIKTDVLIIGGGITGILCGYMLKNAGVDCIVTEANKICGGVTENTTAKITLQHGLMYDKMIKRFGQDAAALYLKAQDKAVLEYKKLCKDIRCDFRKCSSYVYSLSDRQIIEKEAEALSKIGASAVFTEKTELPFSVKGAVRVDNQAQFNPLKFLYALAEKLSVYEQTKIIELRPDCAVTNKGKIKAKNIIVATHFPFINKHGGYFLKMYQHRSYVIALKNAPKIEGMYVDEAKKGMSFHSYEDILLLGGGSHRTGKNGGGWKELEEFAKKNYPKAKEVCRWATQDCMTLDGIPYIGQYSKQTPNFYVATGFNKWGMTSAMAAAFLLADLICGKDSQLAALFSPSRSMLRPQLALNAAEAIMGIVSPTVPRCPHMGCALKYNKQEHTWDCSCHGSRFAEDGKLINNPATDDKRM